MDAALAERKLDFPGNMMGALNEVNDRYDISDAFSSV